MSDMKALLNVRNTELTDEATASLRKFEPSPNCVQGQQWDSQNDYKKYWVDYTLPKY